MRKKEKGSGGRQGDRKREGRETERGGGEKTNKGERKKDALISSSSP